MKRIFTLVFTVCSLSALHAQQPATATGVSTAQTANPASVVSLSPVVADNLLSLRETEFDFGKIPQGKPVIHVFEVINQSTIPLRITDIHASCGCTTPEWEKGKVVAPGEKTNITVGYNAAAEGPFTKFISVSYNDTQTKQITIKGEVWKTPGSSAPENKGLNDFKNK